MTTAEVLLADNLEWMRAQPTDSVDLVFTSPPYEAARTYGIGFNLRGQEFVDWCVERFVECVRISRGLVAWNIEGQTRNYRWSAAPALLMADLHRRGIKLRKPPIFQRFGIPGSGGPDWLRNDFEFIVCASKGRLPWSDNTAMGHPPKWAPGGEMAHRLSDGSKVNQWGHPSKTGGTRTVDGKLRSGVQRPSHRVVSAKALREGMEPKVAAALENGLPPGAKLHTKNNGDEMRVQCYIPPVLANPGNVIECKVGGGLMGSKLAHENEAPFPERLPEFFIRSFCPPGGTVLDPHAGSGTTLAAAIKHGRNAIGLDIRESQVDLCKRRIEEARIIAANTTPSLFIA